MPASISWAFTTTYADFWHPLTWLSLMLDYRLYGLNAGGYHVTNLIFHILSTLLLFALFHRMTRDLWKSAFVAAFFALHPLHVESVAWVSERKDVLSAFFWMLTLYLYVWYTERPAVKRYLLVLCAFVLALTSKPMVVTLPVIMILLDYWPLKRFASQNENRLLWQLREKGPLFVLSAGAIVITFIAQQKPFDIGGAFPLASRLANAPVSFVSYLAKTFLPNNLAAIYPFSYQVPLWQTAGAVLLIIAITAAVILTARRLPYLLTGWFWFGITIAPVIGIIQVGNQAIADRYTYLPLIGISVMLAWGVPFLVKNTRILFPAAIAFLAVMTFLTWKQCSTWQNSATVCTQMLQATQNNYVAHINLGTVLLNEGKTEEAIKHFTETIRIRPTLTLSYNKRGLAYAKLGQYKKAFDDFDTIIYLKPDYADAYASRGHIYQQLGQHQKAVEDFSQAIRLMPDNALLYFNRGNSSIYLRDYRKALDDLNRAIALDPTLYDAYNNRGFVNLNMGNITAACADAQKACRLGNCATLKMATGKGLCR